MRRWLVAGGLIGRGDGQLLPVQNRGDGSLDWTPPGGVVESQEEAILPPRWHHHLEGRRPGPVAVTCL